jgi:hypothetical protein
LWTTRRFFIGESYVLVGVGDQGKSTSYLWLQITVDEIVAMHELEPLGYLGCDPNRVALRKLLGEITLQVPMLQAFHGDVDGVAGFIPAKRLDKVMAELR